MILPDLKGLRVTLNDGGATGTVLVARVDGGAGLVRLLVCTDEGWLTEPLAVHCRMKPEARLAPPDPKATVSMVRLCRSCGQPDCLRNGGNARCE